MRSKQGCRLAALVMTLGLLAPGSARSDNIVHAWWSDHDPDCPRGFYSYLHYWTPGLYRRLYECQRPNLDQYAPGPYPPVAPHYEITRYRCPYTRPSPTRPYVDPPGYFGQPPLSAEARTSTGTPSVAPPQTGPSK
jgi:hypothetical protein